MMTSEFQETYLNRSMLKVGEAFDFAINDLEIEGDLFARMFAGSRVCRKLQSGEPAYVFGKSGVEIALECVEEKTGRRFERIEVDDQYGRTPEFWGGWAVSYYQWTSSKTYEEIFAVISWDELMAMYKTLHEADVSKFAEAMEKRMNKVFPETNLKRLRTAYGCSQSQLAAKSGVSLRSIQMYEQRNKDINCAKAVSLKQIAQILGCRMEELLE